MAERRMFAKSIIDSDMFIDMPASSRLLYYDLSMRADDDGFVNSPKKIMRMTGTSDDDLKMLVAKSFLIPFESGVVVIKHWKIHNHIQTDRYKPTIYIEEKALLSEGKNKEYTLDTPCIQNGSNMDPECIQNGSNMDPECIQNGSNMDPQDRLGKDRLGKDRIELGEQKNSSGKPPKKQPRFSPPSVEDVKAYCIERKNKVDAERFVDYYTANGWKVGKNPMKDWKAAVRTWERKEKEGENDGISSGYFKTDAKGFSQRKYNYSGGMYL